MRKDDSTEYTAEDQGMDLDLTKPAESTSIRYARTARYEGKREQLIGRLNDPSSGLGSMLRELQGKEQETSDRLRRVVIYLRVSTEEQARVGGELEGYSIPAQREACLIKVRQLGGILVEEYVDAGESAKSANRPELQKMLRELKSRKIDYVVVHKIDRLARNRADDVEINAAIARAGAKLISVSEPVDETPAGRLLYNMMADVAQYHSDNLAVEVLKGMTTKAKAGGTPYRAPIGYLNHRELKDGADIRTVIIDPERASLVKWAFEQYALGDWAIRQLVDALNARGLQTRATRKWTAKPMSINGVHKMLRNESPRL
ncbi:recombinase family protein [Glycomyces salinus]|uniref:recombinase family protein n=1 Tax=Glycomyces salinus TaxID=980294 RepID=UPI0018EB1EA2|nr:recombinase family protein [Glycomyces salinus]